MVPFDIVVRDPTYLFTAEAVRGFNIPFCVPSVFSFMCINSVPR